MPARRREWHILQAAKHEATLAVDLYNRPAQDRSLEAFVVHMNIAWTYSAHAIFTRDGTDYRYRDAKGRFKRVEGGEIKTWELSRSIQHLCPDPDDPVRRNVEFFVPLRNMIEHRYARMLEAVVAGRAQSYIVNFEEKVAAEFGQLESLGQALRLPVFLTSLSEDSVAAVKKAFRLLPARVRNFITGYDEQLPEHVRNHPAYELRLYLIAKTAPPTQADAALEFVKVADLTPEQRAKVEESLAIIRNREVPVSNKGYMLPKAVAAAVEARMPWKFSHSWHHGVAARHFKIKAADGSPSADTDTRYCIHDEAHGGYVYKPAWVEKLVRELSSEEGFEAVFRRKPTPKE